MIYVFSPVNPSAFLVKILDRIELSSAETEFCTTYSEKMKGQKVLFCFELDEFGDCTSTYLEVKGILSANPLAFDGSMGALIVISKTEFSTKRFAQQFIFNMSQKGVSFIGHPLVEIIEDYKNLHTWQKTIQLPLDELGLFLVQQLVERFQDERYKRYRDPKILVLHASQDSKSNTLTFWKMIEEKLQDLHPRTLHVENGTIVDCKGCGFTQCIHYSESMSCFYGGQVVMEILPAIEEADIVIWLLPNYNDAISAMLTALINRMTVLYRRKVLHEKSIMAIVVSGNSGSDSVACQLIGALNINKGLFLPDHFLFSTIANDPGSVMQSVGIEEAAERFAERIRALVI